jgi:hypothetical protein
MKPGKPIAAARETEDGEIFVAKRHRPAEAELKPVNFPAVRVSPPESQAKAFNIRVPWPADGPGMSRYVEREDQLPREPAATPVDERYAGLTRDAGDHGQGRGR